LLSNIPTHEGGGESSRALNGDQNNKSAASPGSNLNGENNEPPLTP